MLSLNKEILRLALPSILANITVPLVGMASTAVAGHLPVTDVAGAATFIGAISVGAMLFNLLYWNFGFLRTGTGGLTAQAFGRGDMHECARIFARGVALAALIAAATLMLQWPFVKLALMVVGASPEVEALAAEYFFARIWAAPATLSLMAFRGWFVGMQDSLSSMWTDLIVNVVNIAMCVVLALGVGDWKGIGFVGVAWGTVIAQYSGLAFCICICCFKYRRKVFSHFHLSELRDVMKGQELRSFLKMNMDLFGRSVCFTAIYIGYTMIAAGFGDLMLACSSIMMQLLMLFSYFTDGFAYAGEALTGRFIGAEDERSTRRTVKYVFVWSISISMLFMVVYWLCGEPLLGLLTSDKAVVAACMQFIPWLILMPPIGCAAFTWDGIYLGATASRPIFLGMLAAALGFVGFWFASKLCLDAAGISPIGRYQSAALHLLLCAYFVHLLIRTVFMSARYRKSVLSHFNHNTSCS